MPSFGPFELVKRLGTGTCAEVYLARGPNAAAAEPFVLKTFLPHAAPDERARKALLKDLEPARRLRHPTIVQLYETGDLEGRVYVACEWVRGQPVGALVRKMREAGKALSLAEAAYVTSQVAAALEAALAQPGADGKPLGLLHRDLTPRNILISTGGEVKVTDFGTARTVQAAAQVAGELKSRLPYFSPEQLQKRATDARADVFSLGSLLWELLTGQRLFNGKNEEELTEQLLQRPLPKLEKLLPDLPREVVELLGQTLQRDRERRVPSAGVLADVLLPFTTPETPRKLGSRIESLFEPLLNAAEEAAERGARRTPKPSGGEKASGRSPAPRPAEKPRGSGVRPVVPIGADATMKDHPAAPPPAAARAPRSPDPEERLERDRAVVVHPLLAARPARRRARLDLPEDDGIDHRVGYSEGTVSRLLRLNQPTPRKLSAVWGILGATLLIVFALWAYTRVGIPRAPSLEPEPPRQVETTPTPTPTPPPQRASRGTVQLQSDVPAFVRQGGKDLGMTPLTLTLPAGSARLELRTPDGALSTRVTVQVPAGGEITRRVKLRPE